MALWSISSVFDTLHDYDDFDPTASEVIRYTATTRSKWCPGGMRALACQNLGRPSSGLPRNPGGGAMKHKRVSVASSALPKINVSGYVIAGGIELADESIFHISYR